MVADARLCGSRCLRLFGALAQDGARMVWRLPTARGLALLALPLSAAAIWAPIPLREAGVFSLVSFAALDQFLIFLLLASFLLAGARPDTPVEWPLSDALGLVARFLGIWAGVTGMVLLLLGLQYVGAYLAGDLAGRDPIHGGPLSLDEAYLVLAARLLLYGLILTAWAVMLRVMLSAPVALLLLLALVFTAFLVTRGPFTGGARILTALLPDLGSLAPDMREAVLDWPGVRAWAYALTHSAALLGVALLSRVLRRGRGMASVIESPGREP